jgi:hypothetical protein
MAGSKEKVRVFLNKIPFLLRIEVVDLHALLASGTVSVLHRVGATVLKIQGQYIPELPVSGPPYLLLRDVLTYDSGLRGSRHTLAMRG